ncbi:hypothetical protein NB693_21310 [Pantoea ananatis]|uniref:hypothetical protein n=1 Tax=Pantoea ananas TaxID=553 RepID=UPI00221EFE72|nr:hypothetical protein [Pantoea ananatis]
MPDAWMAAVQQVDEIVVATEFVAEAFRAVTNKPVTRIPFPLLPMPASALSRAHLGLPDDVFVFLCTFDCNSSLERKNPAGVIEAFRQAFPLDQGNVRLLLKSSNGARNPESLIQLAGLIGEDRRILLRDGVIDASHVATFLLGMAECMRLLLISIRMAKDSDGRIHAAQQMCSVLRDPARAARIAAVGRSRIRESPSLRMR